MISRPSPPTTPSLRQTTAAQRPSSSTTAPLSLSQLRALSIEDIQKLGGAKLKTKPARLRFAPSPSGHLHIGGARTALVNYLFAQKMGGAVFLRFEDTDPLRSKPKFVESIQEGLRWLGLRFEGAPTFQSQRGALYAQKTQSLLDRDLAYRNDEGAVMFKMPKEGLISVHDRLRGRVVLNVGTSEGLQDFVIQRCDGTPTFLLANVVDDIEQQISHVIRGDDHLSNTARQLELYRALGGSIPEFYHLPLMHADSAGGRGAKLSKRNGAASVLEFKRAGYHREVLVNHLARVGLCMGTETTLQMRELVERFDPLRLKKTPAAIGRDKLDRRMLMHIARMPLAAVISEAKARILNPARLSAYLRAPGSAAFPEFEVRTGVAPDKAEQLLAQLDEAAIEALAAAGQRRLCRLGELVEMAVFFRGPAKYKPQDTQRFGRPQDQRRMRALLPRLAQLSSWTMHTLERALERFNADFSLGFKDYTHALRWMLTGVKDGIPLHQTMALLGRTRTLQRLQERTERRAQQRA